MGKLLLDARGSMGGEDLLSTLALAGLEPSTRAKLVQDVDVQRGLGTLRHCDVAAGGFYRSLVMGPATAPTRVAFELACFLVAEPLKVATWYATRDDVTWVDGTGWRLVDFSDGLFGPDVREMTNRQRQEYLTGPGWRPFA